MNSKPTITDWLVRPAAALALMAMLALPASVGAQDATTETTEAPAEEVTEEAAEEATEEADEQPERPTPPERLAGHPDLPIGFVGDGTTANSTDAPYRFYCDQPGLLTVAARDQEGADLTLVINNGQGRRLPDGRADIDFNGDTGSEHITVALTETGWYEVVVDPLGSGGPYWVSGSWLPIPQLNEVGEAVATRREPVELNHGDSHQAMVRGSYSTEAWYTFTAPEEGMVIFEAIGNGNGGDLVIEAYDAENLDNYFDRADDDRRGSLTNEMVSADIRSGQTFMFKVVSRNSSPCTFNARLRFVSTNPDREADEDAAEEATEEAAEAVDAATEAVEAAVERE